MTEETEALADQKLTCCTCAAPFLFTAGEAAFFRDKGFLQAPTRCPACRQRVHTVSERRICRACRGSFALTARDRDWFITRKMALPFHCRKCREARRAQESGRRVIAAAEERAL